MQATDRCLLPGLRCIGVLLGVLLCGMACLAQTGPAPTGRVFVADVLVQGNKLIPTQQIMAMVKTRAGALYSPEMVQEDVRTLVASRQFANVKADYRAEPDGRITVIFTVQDQANLVQHIVYNGAKHLGRTDDDINKITGLHLGMPLDPVSNRAACQAIIRKLNEDGRPFASCELVRGDKPSDSDVIFNIGEGPKVKITAIDFEGNTWEPASILQTHINSSHAIAGIGLFLGTLNEAMIDNDITKLEEYYKAFGYLDVHVSRELHWNEDGETATLIFHVREGVRFQIKDRPQVTGSTAIPVEQLEQEVGVKPNQYYSQADIDKDLNRIKDYLGKQGYETRAQAIPVFDKNSPGVCTVQYEVVQRPPARVGQVIIINNERTRQNVILRQVPFYPGQVLSYPDLNVAKHDLERLGIFKPGSVEVTAEDDPVNADSDLKNIFVKVEEDNTGSLLFGVGVNSDAGLTGSIVLNERNFDITRLPTSIDDLLSGNAFRGAGQEFRIEAVPGTQLQRYTASWREPFLFDTQFSLGVSAYYYDRVYNEDTESRLGSRITLGRKLDKYWTASASLRIENVGINNLEVGDPVDYTSVEGNNFLLGFGAHLTYDDRDSVLRATEGGVLDLSYEECTGAFTFPLVNVDYNKYFTVWQRPDGTGRQVLALHSSVGWAGDNTPVYERFYGGGFRSMRGFEFRGVGPAVENNGVTYEVGGDFMLLNSLEYQVPLVAKDAIYAVAFVDSGTVESNVEIRDYRVSAGVGLRIVVPMLGQVPIALDFGFPIVKGPLDQTQMFSFWLGFFR
ncbi:MAG TPA: outer membrane protein assembly factor BamA [Gemmataceae bacterium]|nr:outer membrane protein assembly factor BamA [Gemmataceae bacterium]